jgi:hypothetical protein
MTDAGFGWTLKPATLETKLDHNEQARLAAQ